jgi:secretion/DNA translocation related TadE-like protein
MDNVKRLVKHWFAWIRGSDEGSGTISGVALIAVAAIMLGAAASAGNLLLCLHRAQNAADLASVASGSSDPCSVAERTISGNNATIGSCAIEGEDVLVEAQVGTQMPFVSHVGKQSRAGPIVCE